MFQRTTLLTLLIIILLASGCSKNKISINERLDDYITLWKNEQFVQMYDMLTDEALESYSEDDFITRYEKIYKDIGASNISITYPNISDDELKQARKNKAITVPLSISFDSIAGEINFTNDIELLQVEKDNEIDWQIEWNPGLIFPELANGGSIKIETLEPKRGEILDRNKMPLAINDLVYEVGIVPQDFSNKDSEVSSIAKALGVSETSIHNKLAADWVKDDLFVPIKKITKDQEYVLSQLKAIPAVSLKEVSGRAYPSGKAAAHLTGYIGQITAEEYKKADKKKYRETDEIGKRGLEQLFEDRLKGERGVRIVTQNTENEALIAEKQAKDGETISITIDVNAQEKIFNSYGNLSGTAAAINPKTGEVLALVSSPAFDPHDFLYGISESKWNALQSDPQKPLINRFSSLYAPGSVIKPITAAIGLNTGDLDPNEALTINGLTWGKKDWGDYKITRVSSTGLPVDLKDALKRSDNIYFAMQSLKIGDKKFTDGLKGFGFAEKIPLAYPISQSSISNQGHLKEELLLANTSYGQGEIEVTSLHMATMYSAFINEGNLIKPTLLLNDKTGQVWHENLMSKEDAKLVSGILRDVVATGTAKVANIEGFPISGKTGTAELKTSSSSAGRENGWFVGYPTESEDIIIAMMVEHVESLGASGFVAKKVANILHELEK